MHALKRTCKLSWIPFELKLRNAVTVVKTMQIVCNSLDFNSVLVIILFLIFVSSVVEGSLAVEFCGEVYFYPASSVIMRVM